MHTVKERGPVAEPCGQHLRQRFLIFTVSVKKDGEGEKKEEKRRRKKEYYLERT